MDLFKVSPDLRQTFSFFEYYKIDDEKFYMLVTKHGLRILGMVSQLVKQVFIVLTFIMNPKKSKRTAEIVVHKIMNVFKF